MDCWKMIFLSKNRKFSSKNTKRKPDFGKILAKIKILSTRSLLEISNVRISNVRKPQLAGPRTFLTHDTTARYNKQSSILYYITIWSLNQGAICN